MNPIQMMINTILQQNPNLKPVWEQAVQMTKGKDDKQIGKIINNVAKTQNIDLDKMQKEFMQMASGMGMNFPSGRK